MTDRPSCPRCDKPVHDMAYVCRPCTTAVEADLARVARIAGEITTTVAKLDRIERDSEPDADPWEKNPNALYPMALPVRLSKAATHDAAVNELLTWARHVEETRGITMMGSGHPLALLAEFVAGQLDWLRHRQEADEALRAISDACRALVNVVDVPRQRWYAGRCTCGIEMNPYSGARKVVCSSCGAEYDPDDRKVAMLDELAEMWLTADQSSHALGVLGLPVAASTIRTWASAHRLAPHPDSLAGRQRYRVGSVRELVEQLRAEQKERALGAAERTAQRARKAVAA